eukprot:TRINITY_DN16753_c0_g1_i1.p1 TRINITY_DN16753_c0_g1~~TRINITY_DN16753_c0_g1_i1.p1  ORF type:complete len:180 (+),score=59.85 TRINITY_DN16753_c0_g1_i1:66-605(+)
MLSILAWVCATPVLLDAMFWTLKACTGHGPQSERAVREWLSYWMLVGAAVWSGPLILVTMVWLLRLVVHTNGAPSRHHKTFIGGFVDMMVASAQGPAAVLASCFAGALFAVAAGVTSGVFGMLSGMAELDPRTLAAIDRQVEALTAFRRRIQERGGKCPAPVPMSPAADDVDDFQDCSD